MHRQHHVGEQAIRDGRIHDPDLTMVTT